MNVSSGGHSATIYEFPRGGRSGLADQRRERVRDLEIADFRAMPVVYDSWYHQEAIQQDRNPPKRS